MKRMFIQVIGISALIAGNAFCMNINLMMPVLEKAKKGITENLSSIDKELSATAGELSAVDLKGEKARQILSQLCENKPYLIDCAIIDPAGKMIMVEPQEYKQYAGSDISGQAHIIALQRDKKPVLSDVFRSVEGIDAIDFEYPILSDKNELLGSVSMLVKQKALSEDIIMPLVLDIPCKAWIMQKNGLVIYDPDPGQIGKNIFSDELFKPFPDLISFSRTVAMENAGAGSYDFYSLGLENKTIVKKYVVWDTVSLYGTPWRIIVMEAEKPAPKPEEKPAPKK